MNLPTKPIESATVFFLGSDSEHGETFKYTLELFLDVSVIPDEERHDAVIKLRNNISNLYEKIFNEPPSQIRFDFEMENYKAKENLVFDKEEEERLTSLELDDEDGTENLY